MPEPITTSAVRHALERVVTRFAHTSHDGFEGSVNPLPELVGPPGRLHGGLHPMVRLFAPLTALGVSESRPLHVALSLRAAIPLGVETPFTGTLDEDASGLRVRTHFGHEGRLDAEASTSLRDAALGLFAEEYRACLEGPEVKRILARGSVPLRIGTKTVSAVMDAAFFATPSEVSAYRAPNGTFDEAFAGVALDLLGAVAVAVVHKTHVFTTHLSLDFHVRKVPAGTSLVALSSIVRAAPDTTSSVKPVEVNGVLVPPTCVPVLLADASLSTPFVSGTVTVVPVRDARVG